MFFWEGSTGVSLMATWLQPNQHSPENLGEALYMYYKHDKHMSDHLISVRSDNSSASFLECMIQNLWKGCDET